MSWIYFLDLFGTCIFAISGVLTALQKKFDSVGTLIIGFVTAIGGGTLRDILIGRSPVGWLNDRNYLFAIILGYIVAYLFRARVIRYRKSMFLFDTVGIGLFTILGIQISMQYDLNVEFCLILGVISACFGGVLRDVLTNEIPLIFRKEIYATACFAGGAVYLSLNQINSSETVNILLAIAVVILIRALSIKYKWTINFSPRGQ